MDKEARQLHYQFRRHAKLSSDICAAVSTVGIWASVATVAVLLGGDIAPPMLAATFSTVIVWSMRKME